MPPDSLPWSVESQTHKHCLTTIKLERADSFASLPGEDILTDWVDEMRRAHTRGRNVAGITTNKLSGNVAFFFFNADVVFSFEDQRGGPNCEEGVFLLTEASFSTWIFLKESQWKPSLLLWVLACFHQTPHLDISSVPVGSALCFKVPEANT